MSNAERQRKFRAANPGYFNKYNNRRKARRIAAQKKVLALFKELAKAKAAATQQQQPALPAPLAIPVEPMLMLPAPVQDPTMDALNDLAASIKSKSTAREPLSVATPATCPADRSIAA
jgi:hypothetical protein